VKLTLVYQGRESLDVESLSAACKAAGHGVRFIYDPGSFTASDNVFQSQILARKYARTDILLQRLVQEKTDLVYFHADSHAYTWCKDLAARLRERSAVPIVFGGRHPTFAPKAVMENRFVDNVLIGETEESFPELVEALAQSKPIANVLGVYFREDDQVRFSGQRAPIKNLDALPPPDKSVFENEILVGDDFVFSTGRGCPHLCSYCQEGTLHKTLGPGYFRRRKAASILAELETMKGRYRFSTVMINDPVFFTSKPWILEFLKGYREKINVPFRCYGQLKYLDDEIALALKQSGCYGVEFGYQTSSDKLRKEVCLRPETNEDAQRAFAICDRRRLRYDVDLIIGLPGEAEADFVVAAEMLAGARYLNRIKVHNLVYYPGAPILRIAQEMGLADEQDVRQAEAGATGDVCRTGSVRRVEVQQRVRDWDKFFKVMPILGARLSRYLARRRLNRFFGYLPSPLVMALQLLVAIRGGDRRFSIYIRYIFFRFKAHRNFLSEARQNNWL
jgi:radical SAM superfamily enzyme YgiQ (UPF0313 family)